MQQIQYILKWCHEDITSYCSIKDYFKIQWLKTKIMLPFSQICRWGTWAGFDWAVSSAASNISKGRIAPVFSFHCTAVDCSRKLLLPTCFFGRSICKAETSWASFLLQDASNFSKCSLQEGSYPLYIEAKSSKRKWKMPILLKTRPIMDILSFLLYSNYESHRLTDFKGKGERFHPSLGRELMNLEPVLICHKCNSSYHILCVFPVLPFILF